MQYVVLVELGNGSKFAYGPFDKERADLIASPHMNPPLGSKTTVIELIAPAAVPAEAAAEVADARPAGS